MRLAAYIHSLREMGFTIDTELEQHDGPYAGHHARYRLRSIVLRTEMDKKAGT
ncbi:MAG: winged helix domain-containing protein [Octadecabacter sp.]